MITSLIKAVRNSERVIKQNSPVVLASLAGAGLVSSVYLTARATWRASEQIHVAEAEGGTHDDAKERFKERSKLVWKEYIPPAVSTSATLVCLFGSLRSGQHKTAVAMTAYSVTEHAFQEYREKVIEQIGVKKDEEIRGELAQATVQATPPSRDVIIAGGGDVLCCELFTKRYFTCDMQTLRKAQNDINSMLNNELYATMSDFYYLIGLDVTAESDSFGWDSDKQMDLEFCTVMSSDDRPCLAFSYNYFKVL